MKRFKDNSDLSFKYTGGAISKEISPLKSIYSQTTPPLHTAPGGRILLTSPPPLPPHSPTFKGIPLPDDFVERVRDAIKIANAQMQKDEERVWELHQKAGLLGVAGYLVNNVAKFNFLGPEWSKIATFVGAAGIFSAVMNYFKPAVRLLFVKMFGLEELSQINELKYKINKFHSVKDPATDEFSPGLFIGTEDMTLKQIADSITNGNLDNVDGCWKVGKYFYTFSDADDVNRIAQMLDRNDFSNKIDTAISYMMPFVPLGGTIAFMTNQIKSAEKSAQIEGDKVIKQNRGVFTKPSAQDVQKMQDAKTRYLEQQKKSLGPKK